MDCQTARHYLDCLHDGNIDPIDDVSNHFPVRAELADHLAHCDMCQQLLEEWGQFDRRMYSMLMSSPIPPGLEDRLLRDVDAELAALSQISSAPRQSGKFRWWTASLLLASVLLMLLGGAWHLSRTPDEILNFNGAGQLLASRFLKSNSAWEDLDRFDGGFDLGSYHDDLGLFQLSAPHGIDLGGGRGQDAAVFQFGMKGWKGIITVLPSQHFTGLPDVGLPNVQPGHSVLQWRSSDGKLTYLCFVHKGSAAALAEELFGLLT